MTLNDSIVYENMTAEIIGVDNEFSHEYSFFLCQIVKIFMVENQDVSRNTWIYIKLAACLHL